MVVNLFYDLAALLKNTIISILMVNMMFRPMYLMIFYLILT